MDADKLLEEWSKIALSNEDTFETPRLRKPELATNCPTRLQAAPAAIRLCGNIPNSVLNETRFRKP